MASTIAALSPASDMPVTLRPAPVTTFPGLPPVTGTEYAWVQPRSRTQNTTAWLSPVSCGSAPG